MKSKLIKNKINLYFIFSDERYSLRGAGQQRTIKEPEQPIGDVDGVIANQKRNQLAKEGQEKDKYKF